MASLAPGARPPLSLDRRRMRWSQAAFTGNLRPGSQGISARHRQLRCALSRGFYASQAGERALLEIWHIGYGPNISSGICVAEPPRAWGTDNELEPGQQALVVRCGYPPGYPLAPPGPMGEEGSITRAAFAPAMT
jgi:hypothetical protein